MSLYILQVKSTDPKAGTWYFDNRHEFDKAMDLAKVLGIYLIHEDDFVSDFDEFSSWSSEDE